MPQRYLQPVGEINDPSSGRTPCAKLSHTSENKMRLQFFTPGAHAPVMAQRPDDLGPKSHLPESGEEGICLGVVPSASSFLSAHFPKWKSFGIHCLHTRLAPKVDILVHSLLKNCLVLTMVDEHQKLPPHEIDTKSGHLSTQFSKELPCVGHG